ncbi:unnamed protein product [Aphanomyces euteiches]|uniref:FYVE-type domain-containing protein n=1 Tax=Aphanomyces euteiches TaxID=100861 RepID=A0A6G0WBH4_9STRA|nr:hypothetical protein Ae201684_016620 [Aphanomyces euteiches]KAH9078093.1 hypothetical protein Ae201684P_019196 [Aphanomyces euteiches]KAH9131968.1 hypothetical protein AeRB84_021491 [Aphanomyces euteiches]
MAPPSFPLPPGFFRCPPLSDHRRDEYIAQSRDVASECILNSRVANPDLQWKFVDDTKGVQIYQGTDLKAPPRAAIWLGVTTITASLDEIPPVNVAHDDAAFKASKALTEKELLLDCMHLYGLSKTDLETVNVRWLSVKFPFAALIKPRDFCYLEAQIRFTLDGRQGYVITASSVELECCPVLHDTLGLVRGFFYRTGTIYLETERPGKLQVSRLVESEFGGSMPTWVIDMAQRKRMKSMRDLDQFFQERRLSGTPFLARTDLVPKSARSKCFLCQLAFGVFTGKTHCRKCGEVMCRTCTRAWTINISGFDVKVKICTACTLLPREPNAPSLIAGSPLLPRSSDLSDLSSLRIQDNPTDGAAAAAEPKKTYTLYEDNLMDETVLKPLTYRPFQRANVVSSWTTTEEGSPLTPHRSSGKKY